VTLKYKEKKRIRRIEIKEWKRTVKIKRMRRNWCLEALLEIIGGLMRRDRTGGNSDVH